MSRDSAFFRSLGSRHVIRSEQYDSTWLQGRCKERSNKGQRESKRIKGEVQNKLLSDHRGWMPQQKSADVQSFPTAYFRRHTSGCLLQQLPRTIELFLYYSIFLLLLVTSFFPPTDYRRNQCTMAARHVEFVVVYLLFLFYFSPPCLGTQHAAKVVYSRDQLLAFRDTAVLLPEVRPEFPHKLRRKKQGCRAGAKRRARNTVDILNPSFPPSSWET